jgi:hypothetical protein
LLSKVCGKRMGVGNSFLRKKRRVAINGDQLDLKSSAV